MHYGFEEAKNVRQPVKKLYESADDIRPSCIHFLIYSKHIVDGKYSIMQGNMMKDVV